jgi:hypothetical protein
MRQSKSDFAARKAQNKGVRHGTTKMGKGGKVMRRYNAKTARWEAVGSARAGMPERNTRPSTLKPKGTAFAQYSAYAAPKSSWGSAWTSTGGAGSPNRAIRRPGTPRPSLFGSKRPKGPRTSKTIVSMRTGRS